MTTPHEKLLTIEEILELNGGEIVATDISIDEYMEKYAADHCEYIDGVVIKMAPQTITHDSEYYYVRTLLEAYFELRPIGQVLGHPFVMRLPAFPNRRREPDLMVVLDENSHELKEMYMDGAADICVEIISKESAHRDRGVKFDEYEQGGVTEYWLLDSVRKHHMFYRLDESGVYQPQALNRRQEYITPLLPDLRIHVPTIWLEKPPGPVAIATTVQKMLRTSEK